MLKIENLSASYGKKQVLFDISVEIETRKLTVIIGRNGSGKSTLLSSIVSLMSHTGRIFLDGCDISALKRRDLAKKISYLPQNLPVTPFSIYETVAFGREPYLDLSGRLGDEDKKAVNDAVEKCGIGHIAEKRINEISGGERQMAYLAMTFAQDAEIMLFDEPTTYMDAPNAREFMNLLSYARDEKKTVLAVMHDIGQALRYANNVILIEHGRIAFSGSRDDALSSGIIEEVMDVKAYRLNDGTVVFI